MKITALFAVLLFFAVSSFAAAQSGSSYVSECGVVQSKILDEEMHYSIYLPAGCDPRELNSETLRKYPVLYLLHGYSDDHTGWTQFGEVQRIADETIRSGKASPMIIVMPDAKKTFYVNKADGSYSFEDYFFKELIPHIESHYPCRTKKEFRAVAGLSMGGFGSFLYAVKHPEMFAAACPLSAAVYSEESVAKMPYDRYKERFTEFLGTCAKEGEDRMIDAWNVNNVERILKNIAKEKKDRAEAEKKMSDDEKKAATDQRRKHAEEDRAKSVRFYIDCGDKDFLFDDNARVPALLRDAKIPFEFRVRAGGHSWSYWRESLPEVLAFISESFRR